MTMQRVNHVGIALASARDAAHTPRHMRPSRSCLPGLCLPGVHLSRSRPSESDLSGSDLPGSRLLRPRLPASRLIVLLVAAPLLAGAGVAQRRSLELVNHASRAMNQVYVSPQSDSNWGADRLGDDTLAPGATLRLDLGQGTECHFDVQIVFDNASREEHRGLDLCGGARLVTDGSTAVLPPDALGPLHDVTIIDESALPIQQVFISPADASDWGDDLLGPRLSVGTSRQVSYRGDCIADLRIVFENKAAEERRGIDFCAAGKMVIHPGWTTAP